MSNNAASQVIVTELIKSLLVENMTPDEACDLFVERIREIIGGKLVLLVSCTHAEQQFHTVISACPKRKEKLINLENIEIFATQTHNYTTPILVELTDEQKKHGIVPAIDYHDFLNFDSFIQTVKLNFNFYNGFDNCNNIIMKTYA